MNFFKSVFADEEPDSPKSESQLTNTLSQSDPDPNSLDQQNPSPNLIDHSTGDAGGGWGFGGLIKTLTTKSESVIEIYRRDLKEFGSGLKKEIEVAQGSLENVGHAIDEIGSSVLKGTAQFISQGKEAILAADLESDLSDNNERSIASQSSLNSKPYSRFDAQVRSIQGDASIYCEEPEDWDDYQKWKSTFVLEEKREEIGSLLEENDAMESLYKTFVPNSVDEETFWCRYYYKLYKLKQAEDVRANLVKRAISTEEEDLSWDVDDEEEEKEEKRAERSVSSEANLKGHEEEEEGEKQAERSENLKANLKENEDFGVKSSRDEKDEKQSEKSVKNEEKNVNVEEEVSVEELKGEVTTSSGEKVDSEDNKEDTVPKSDDKSGSEGKGDNGEYSKDSDVSVISSHPSMPEEEDLGWDEIEDLSSIDEKKVSHSGSPNRAGLRKRLTAADEEEDLSWDIEDDDEPVNA